MEIAAGHSSHYRFPVRMIALILGWHLIALSLVTAGFGIIFGVISDIIIAVILCATGLVLALRFRDVCANYRSDPPQPETPERELDYY